MKRFLLPLLAVLVAQASTALAAPLSLPQLPPLEIFGLSTQAQSDLVKYPFDIDRFEKETKRYQPAAPDFSRVNAKDQEPHHDKSRLFLVPMALASLRPLYSKTSWTPDERKSIEKTAAFIGRRVPDRTLQQKVSDDASARATLIKLRNWFALFSQKNENLAELIFTLDDGPFRGEPVSFEQLSTMNRAATFIIPGQVYTFGIWRDPAKSAIEPMVIGLIRPDKKLLWARRLSGEQLGKVANFELAASPLQSFPGYGYTLAGTAKWTYGSERATIYLDSELNLRFYFISW